MYNLESNHSPLNTIQLVHQARSIHHFSLYSEQLKMWDNGTMAPSRAAHWAAPSKLKIVGGTKYFYACVTNNRPQWGIGHYLLPPFSIKNYLPHCFHRFYYFTKMTLCTKLTKLLFIFCDRLSFS